MVIHSSGWLIAALLAKKSGVPLRATFGFTLIIEIVDSVKNCLRRNYSACSIPVNSTKSSLTMKAREAPPFLKNSISSATPREC